MARFPKSEAEIAALTRRVMTGLTAHAEDFPNPPISPQELEESLAAYDAAKDAAITADGAARTATAVKDDALEELVDRVKADLRYAENTARHTPEKLANLGWSARKEGGALEPPGQVRSLESSAEGPGWVVLTWSPPTGGGPVAAYKIQRSTDDVEQWIDVGVAVETQALVNGQERGTKLVYHVIAVNKAGEGKPSNIVTVVL